MPTGWEKAPGYGSTGGIWTTVLSVIAALLFSAAVGWLYFAGEGARAQETTIAGVASVIDGDTIEIHGTRVRLSGFDTPESNAPRCGTVNVHQRAANELDAFIAGRTVTCATTSTDRYGRAVATCSVGGTDLGEHIVSQGWGRDWPRYSGGAYADEEAAARRASRGLWGLSCPGNLWGTRNYSR